MKKVISLLVLVLSIQTMNAHVITSQHTHDSLVGEWAWILIPCIILSVLILTMVKKSITLKKKVNNL